MRKRLHAFGLVAALMACITAAAALAASPRGGQPSPADPGQPAFCAIREAGKTTWRGACRRDFAKDGQGRTVYVVAAGPRTFSFVDAGPVPDARFDFNGRSFKVEAGVHLDGLAGSRSRTRVGHALFRIFKRELSVEVADFDVALDPQRHGLPVSLLKARICEVRKGGGVAFHGPCLEESGEDSLSRNVVLLTAGGAAYRFLVQDYELNGRKLTFNSNPAQVDRTIGLDGRAGYAAIFEDYHEVYVIPGQGLSIEVAVNEDAFGPDKPGRTLVSRDTGKPERLGQCFDTRVNWVGYRLGEPGTGSSIRFTDNHTNVEHDDVPAMTASRVGDPVRLCVTSLPRNCPPGDIRGIGYSALNHRTGDRWRSADATHLCGGL